MLQGEIQIARLNLIIELQFVGGLVHEGVAGRLTRFYDAGGNRSEVVVIILALGRVDHRV